MLEDNIFELYKRPSKKTFGLNTIFKIGNANSGNRGHSGRPGQVGGSGSGGGSETSSLFAKSDQEIRDIEAGQGTISNDVFNRTLEAKDFGIGGKYQGLTQEYLGVSKEGLESKLKDDPNLIVDVVDGNNDSQESMGHASPLLSRVNKFDSQNALYDKLKDNKNGIR